MPVLELAPAVQAVVPGVLSLVFGVVGFVGMVACVAVTEWGNL